MFDSEKVFNLAAQYLKLTPTPQQAETLQHLIILAHGLIVELCNGLDPYLDQSEDADSALDRETIRGGFNYILVCEMLPIIWKTVTEDRLGILSERFVHLETKYLTDPPLSWLAQAVIERNRPISIA